MMYDDVYLSGKCLVAMPDMQDEIFKNRKKEIESNNLPMPIEVKKENFLKQIIDYIKI